MNRPDKCSYTVKKNSKCPRCSSKLTIRWNGKLGAWFVGCTAFPDCKYSLSIHGEPTGSILPYGTPGGMYPSRINDYDTN